MPDSVWDSGQGGLSLMQQRKSRLNRAIGLFFALLVVPSSLVQATESAEITRTELDVSETPQQIDRNNPSTYELANNQVQQINPVLSNADEQASIDDLIRQARNRAVPAHQALLRKLQARKEVAVALKDALTVAAEVAKFGEAGVQLLNDANLETVVELLFDEHEDVEQPLSPSFIQPELSPVKPVVAVEPEVKRESYIDGFVPIFVQRIPAPLRVGLQHRLTGEYVLIQAGETKRVNQDRIRLLRITERRGEREVAFDVNGEEWRATFKQ